MTAADRNPYVGLRPFDVDDCHYFHGRSSATWELATWLLSSRLVIVYGPAGVGKTSLIQAGVLPRLGPDKAQVLPVAKPVGARASAVAPEPSYNPFAANVLSSWAPDLTTERLRDMTIAGFLADVPVSYDRYEDALPLVAVIDQFEQVFVEHPGWTRSRHGFLEQLVDAVAWVPHLQLLLSMRGDVLSEILPYEQRLSRGSRKRFPVAPLDVEGAVDAATGPLRATGRSFAPGTAEALVDRLRTTTLTNALGEVHTVTAETIEPEHLQVVCSGLWDALPDYVATITSQELLDFGDHVATLLPFCTKAVYGVAAAENVPEAVLWEWLELTFITDLGTRASAYEGFSSTAGMPSAVARAFEQRRLLRSQTRFGSVWFELAHDGLIEPIRQGRRMAEAVAVVGAAEPTTDGYLRMAEGALADGTLSLAEEYARRAMLAAESDPPLLAGAASLLARVVQRQGDDETGERADDLYATAEGYFHRAAELLEVMQNPRAVGRVLASLGQLSRDRHRFADAIQAFQGATSRLPDDVDIRLGLAQALSEAGQSVAAQGEYTNILTTAPNTVEALVGRGILAAEHGDPSAALADLDSAVRQRPDLADDPRVRAAATSAAARTRGR